MMRLSRKKAIELCIALWEWLAKTGKYKEAWPEWDKYGNITCDCWFCEYDERQKKRHKEKRACIYCPFRRKWDVHCSKTFFENWEDAKTPRTRKKYAKLFLAQIKEIK
jgi:hypothetical protein